MEKLIERAAARPVDLSRLNGLEPKDIARAIVWGVAVGTDSLDGTKLSGSGVFARNPILSIEPDQPVVWAKGLRVSEK
ncbi:MAG: hypothetical protein V1921_09175 [Candidatus Altiarchaeota archaeon]